MNTSSLSALRARIARLQRRADDAQPTERDGGACSVVALAIAIGVGGYPQPCPEPHVKDGYGDAFARALGYADREALDAVDFDSDDYMTRMDRAVTALCEHAGEEGGPPTDERLIRACAAVFDAAPEAVPASAKDGLSALVAGRSVCLL